MTSCAYIPPLQTNFPNEIHRVGFIILCCVAQCDGALKPAAVPGCLLVVPGGFLVGDEGGRGSQRTTQVLPDVDLLCRRSTVDRLLSGDLHRLPLTLDSYTQREGES